AKIVWIGGMPATDYFTKSKKGNSWPMLSLTFHDKKESFVAALNEKQGEWLTGMLQQLNVDNQKLLTLAEVRRNYETAGFADFEMFWHSKPISTLRSHGLLSL